MSPKRPAGPTKKAKKSPRRPRQERAHATRDAILGAAAQLFARRGYAGTNTNQIAARAGVSVGSVYEYFRSKDTVLQALLDAHLAQGEALITERATVLVQQRPLQPLRTIIGELVGAMLAFHAEDPALHAVLTSEALRSKAARARIVALEEQATLLVRTLLTVHPEAKTTQPDVAARMVVAAVDALTHRWIIEPVPDAPSPERLAEELTRMVSAYLQA